MLSFRGGYNRILPSETIRLIKLDKNLGCAIGDGILCVNVEVMLSEYDLPVASDYYTPRRVTTDYKKLKMSISIGDKYWDASKNKWVDNTVNNLFKLEYEDGKDTNIWQLPVTNAKDYIGEYKEAFGICIPILDQVLVGDVKIQIYASPTDGIVTYWQHFRDLKVDFYRKDIRNDYLGRKRLTVKELKETDTIFTNVVTDKFNNPYKDIKLKVSSDNDKGLSMSSPTTYIDNKYNFLYAIVKNGKSASPEYWLIDMFLKQFKYPRKKYEIELNKAYIPMGTLMTNDGSNYIITDMEWDVISAQQNLNLVEWK